MMSLALVGALLLAATSPAGDLTARLDAAAKQYNAAIPNVAPITGTDTAADYLERLLDDRGLFAIKEVPQGYTQTQYEELIENLSTLDIDVANQLIHRTYARMSDSPGVHEVFVKSTVDGTMQAVGVYVPPTYDKRKASPLVVLLHGHPQSESQLLAPPYFEDLANSTGSIIVAPYGRGYYNFRKAASQDVYDAFDEALRTFNIDPRKRFLAGYSMGGFSVFEIQAIRHDAWSAVMCISGGLLGPDARSAVSSLRMTPVYVLTGDKDDSIDPKYTTASAEYLASSRIDVTFYDQHDGTHRLVTLLPILNRAWHDMHEGTVHQLVVTDMPHFNLGASVSEPTFKI